MTNAIPPSWPSRRGMPDFATLDEPTRRTVVAAVELLRARQDAFGHRFLKLARTHLPGYDVLTDEEIRATAQQFMDTLVSELSFLRVPDGALRELLNRFAVERGARGIPPEVLAAGYQMGSREMLSFLDEVGLEVGLPMDLLLLAHDSTWEFSNEASSVFARVQHDLALERAHFDAERRSTFAAGVLSGTFPADHITRDAHLFALDPRARYVPLAARAAPLPLPSAPATATPLAASRDAADTIRRAIAAALRMPADRLLFAEVGTYLGFIAPSPPEHITGHLVAAGPATTLDQLYDGFQEATLALTTAEQFHQSGLTRLADLGPRPLVLSGSRIAPGLTARHMQALDSPARATTDIEETTRVYLDCDQQVREVARRLAVHPNTVRYRVHRFQELTGLNLHHTEDLVTAWWLLNRRRTPTPERGQDWTG